MGHLHYGAPPASFEIADRTLAHIEVVVLAKLRRKESFALSLSTPSGGREQIWINPAATLRFEFGSEAEPINRLWLDELMESANAAAGMRIVPEPATA